MKFKHLFLALVLLMASLIAISCKTSGDNGDPDIPTTPNFIQDTPCASCKAELINGNVIIFYSYVKNIGGAGPVIMTIGTGNNNNATKQFEIKAGARYIFKASVTVKNLSKAKFTYSAKFPGTAEYTDTRVKTNLTFIGPPKNLQMTERQ